MPISAFSIFLPTGAVTVMALLTLARSAPAAVVELFAPYEISLQAEGNYLNPYTELSAEAALAEPGGQATRIVPLFWDGGNTWKFRFAPDRPGLWRWEISSSDRGLHGKRGALRAAPPARKGSIRPMKGYPHHFERQNGERFWFLGDTAWALYTDNEKERHHWEPVREYIDARASQGFNVLHSMLLSEAGWTNRGGPPFHDLNVEKLNPAYWQEVDHRLAYANRQGLVCGLTLAWGEKRGRPDLEPYAWRKFPSPPG